MKINELIKKPLSDFRDEYIQGRGHLMKFMKKRGFVATGDGTFALIFEHPNLDYVLKVFDGKDVAYNKFMEYARQEKSPYLPKYRGQLMKIHYDWYAIRIEKLFPTSDSKGLFQIDRYFDYLTGNSLYSDDEEQIKQNEEFIKVSFPGLVEILNDLAWIANEYGFEADLRSENIMMRGNQLVLIDPFYKERPYTS